MNFFKWVNDKLLFIFTLFLIFFIPLYPKLPLLDIKNTWVYIRIEDFIVVLSLIVLAYFVIKKKVTLSSPLTIPILVFWLLGAISTIHGILIIFPNLANVFPNVAFLSYVRRLEYLSVFFLAFSSFRDKKWIKYIIFVLAGTLLLVSIYGIGQRYLGFPAYLTMNEEFAKGEPIRLSPLSRVPSTFAGHYDLAAYLVLIIPIMVSVIFGIKNWLSIFMLAVISFLGFVVMFMTVSRVSFFVLLITLGIVLFIQKRKLVLAAIPVCLVLLIPLINYAPSLVNRLGSTIDEVDVLVDASSGRPIGHAKQVPSDYFKDKFIVSDYALIQEGVDTSKIDNIESSVYASASALRSSELIYPRTTFFPDYTLLTDQVTLMVPLNVSTGESLPQGTGYINLSLSPVKRKIGYYLYEYKNELENGIENEADALLIHGNFLVKKAAAYDLSFTTRFQGEWPNAINAFMRNIFLGSGYGSISLAVDNNYFRLLGEVGLFGTIAFITIFVAAGLYLKRIYPEIDSPLVRSYVAGFCVGVSGLFLNAIFIDVFEASKVAFVLWLLMGLTIALAHLYSKEEISITKDLRKAVISTPAVVVYLLMIVIIIFSPMLSNYFVGDDFTWFRWAAEGDNILKYFTNASGFFYRPGSKLYFHYMYDIFWLNQTVYHSVSLMLHFLTALMVFLIGKKLTSDKKIPIIASFLFVAISGHQETIFWISSSGHLIAAVSTLLSLLCFIEWRRLRLLRFYLLSILSFTLSMLFSEAAVMTPFLFVLYLISRGKQELSFLKSKILSVMVLFTPLIFYGVLRYLSSSHWSGGDYNYNLMKFPLNFMGNLFGYSLLGVFGPISLSIYNQIRSFMRTEILSLFIFLIFFAIVIYIIKRILWKKLKEIKEKTLVGFSLGFFIITLMPFLGLGNITSRYSYLSSISIVLIISLLLVKAYNYLIPQGKNIAVMSISIVIALFTLFHLIQLQEIHGDWKTAGMKAERFIIAIDESYQAHWSTEPMTMNFINIPIRSGSAWVFPVGLTDAMWLNFRNPNVTVNYISSVQEGLNSINNPRNEKVFEIDESGKLIEHKKVILLQ